MALSLGRSALGGKQTSRDVRVPTALPPIADSPRLAPVPLVTTDMPLIYNIRPDPFERTPSINAETLNNLGGCYMNDFYTRDSGASSSCNSE